MEASGGITEKNLTDFDATSVDHIPLGTLPKYICVIHLLMRVELS
ncbi:MAG: hypothetical protein EBW81_11100 [Gammaproteobacteria bacterium]|nr:hypothetical protein [Gammaproteobacteria bacterium]